MLATFATAPALWLGTLATSIAIVGQDAPDKGPQQGDSTHVSSDEEKGWRPLFNGRDLTGWTPKIAGHELGEDPYQTVRVEDGLLRIDYDKYEGSFGGRFLHLFHDESFQNYHLLVEYRFHGEQVAGGPGWAWRNSGAMLHCQDPATMTNEQSFPVSVEGQFLGGDGTNRRSTCNLCTPGTNVVIDERLEQRHCLNSTSETFHGDQWVVAEFIVADGRIEHYVNGDQVMVYNEPQLDPRDGDAKKLIKGEELSLNSGWISLQGESHPIDFKRVLIRSLDEPVDQSPSKEPDDSHPVPTDDAGAGRLEIDGSDSLSRLTLSDPAIWSVDGDELVLEEGSSYVPPHRSPAALAILDEVQESSYVIDVQCMQTGREYGHRDLCIFFDYQDPAHFGYVHLATEADPNSHHIQIVDAAPRTPCTTWRSQGIDWGRGVWHDVRVERNIETGDIRAYFDGTLVLQGYDSRLGPSRIGVGSFDDQGRFRNLTVSPLE